MKERRFGAGNAEGNSLRSYSKLGPS